MTQIDSDKNKFIIIEKKEDIDTYNLNSLEEWTSFLHGRIEVIELKNGSGDVMLVNENEKRNSNYSKNVNASNIMGNMIAGNAALIKKEVIKFFDFL